MLSDLQTREDLTKVINASNSALYIFDDTGLYIRTADGWSYLGEYQPQPNLYGDVIVEDAN